MLASALTTSTWMVLAMLLQALRLLERFFDRADHVEGLLGERIAFARHDHLEALDRVLQWTYLPSWPVKFFATLNGCERKRWIFLARETASLSSGESSSMPRIAMMSRSSL